MMEWKKDLKGERNSGNGKRERGREKGRYVCEEGVNGLGSQAEAITTRGCLFLTHLASLIKIKHLKPVGNVADLV